MKKTKIMTEIAVMTALAVVCSFIKVWEMPQGGSVALTMVPILLISFRLGVASGILTGSIYGLISLAISGVIYHPMSVLLDYILAFGLLGIAGFFKPTAKGIVLGSVTGVFLRFLSSFLSGAVLFGSYAPEGQNVWLYSLTYQATYLIPELVITVAVLLFLYYKANRIFTYRI